MKTQKRAITFVRWSGRDWPVYEWLREQAGELGMSEPQTIKFLLRQLSREEHETTTPVVSAATTPHVAERQNADTTGSLFDVWAL